MYYLCFDLEYQESHNNTAPYYPGPIYTTTYAFPWHLYWQFKLSSIYLYRHAFKLSTTFELSRIFCITSSLAFPDNPGSSLNFNSMFLSLVLLLLQPLIAIANCHCRYLNIHYPVYNMHIMYCMISFPCYWCSCTVSVFYTGGNTKTFLKQGAHNFISSWLANGFCEEL